ncbi:hypothetical protein ABT56_18310 [Photobacterium aquae]|uniref:Uncharacterized protein n=2 Tax=Photobacterium aquae TaxID=1195763 RepID=A0A0J1GV69_9GAMM|nr:hypothetical protein ABT56_18310 [Photobacterium aquae]
MQSQVCSSAAIFTFGFGFGNSLRLTFMVGFMIITAIAPLVSRCRYPFATTNILVVLIVEKQTKIGLMAHNFNFWSFYS